MAYTKGIISIPNVTGDISITVTTASLGFSFDMDRTVVRRASTTSNMFTDSSLWDESIVYDDVNWTEGTSSAETSHADISNKTSNSVTVSLTGGSIGACYPIKVTGGKTYTLSYNFNGTGSVRTNYTTNIDGTASSITTLYNGTDGETGTKTHTISIPAGTECWLFLTFGANTNKTKSYTNVSLTENP